MAKDRMILGPEMTDGTRPCLRYTDGELSSGVLAPLKEGKPILDGTVVSLKHTGPGEVYECEDIYRSPAAERSGPAKANTGAYLSGWERIFGKSKVGVA